MRQLVPVTRIAATEVPRGALTLLIFRGFLEIPLNDVAEIWTRGWATSSAARARQLEGKIHGRRNRSREKKNAAFPDPTGPNGSGTTPVPVTSGPRALGRDLKETCSFYVSPSHAAATKILQYGAALTPHSRQGPSRKKRKKEKKGRVI